MTLRTRRCAGGEGESARGLPWRGCCREMRSIGHRSCRPCGRGSSRRRGEGRNWGRWDGMLRDVSFDVVLCVVSSFYKKNHFTFSKYTFRKSTYVSTPQTRP